MGKEVNVVFQRLRRQSESGSIRDPRFSENLLLAYRGLPVLIAEHVVGKEALDFGSPVRDQL